VSDYRPPVGDIGFVLDQIVEIDRIAALSGFEHADSETVAELLAEAARFAVEQIVPLNVIGDAQGVRLVDGAILTADGFSEAWSTFVDAGWNSVSFDPEYGGGGMPGCVGLAVLEILTSSCMSFSLCSLLTRGATELLSDHGDDAQKELFVPRLISGQWSGTMNLTEPQAGSDVGALKTKATPSGDGSWRISGTKIFITYGDHDMTENIVHLVLARTPDAAPGTGGISCFIVPKFVLNDDGSLGERNDITVVSTEHKLGIRGSPTCVMSFGDNAGAVGYLIGEEGAGMRYMFTMMNAARLAVGLQGLALAERAYQRAKSYAMERVQGRVIGSDDPAATIASHGDVRRMLMTMRANIEAMRALMYENAASMDRAERSPDADERARQDAFAGFYTPLSKAWGSDVGFEMTSLAVQVFGGMGYIEETGIAQHMRDVRIAPIYEGTNGIQALDLVFRKLRPDGGGVVTDLLASIDETASSLGSTDMADIGEWLSKAACDARTATTWMIENLPENPNAVASGATPFLRLMGVTVGGWFLIRAAVAAQALLDDGDTRADLLRDKIAIARFYAENILPATAGLVAPATAGDDVVFAIPIDRL